MKVDEGGRGEEEGRCLLQVAVQCSGNSGNSPVEALELPSALQTHLSSCVEIMTTGHFFHIDPNFDPSYKKNKISVW